MTNGRQGPFQGSRSRTSVPTAIGLWLVLLASSLLAQSPNQVLVVINDNSPDSQAIGYYYAGKRGVPAENLCRISTGTAATISRELFVQEILRPVADCLESGLLMDQILYLVTTRGIPLLIEGRPGAAGDASSVDSELCMLYTYLLYGGYNPYGRAENRYFSVELAPKSFKPFMRSRQGIYLASRLTGPDLAETLRLIDRGLHIVDSGQFYLDLPSEQGSVAREWFEQTQRTLTAAGIPVTLEQTARRVSLSQAAMGFTIWTSEENPGAAGIDWAPGGLALVFEPNSFHPRARIPGQEQEGMPVEARLAPLLQLVKDGATAVAGFLAEPTADDHVRPQTLFPAYASGHNLAESYYLSQRYLSWHSILIGDPLVSPFAANSAPAREILAEESRADMDPETEMPRYYSDRMRSWLQRRYGTSEEAVLLYVKAVGRHATGRQTEAEDLLEEALLKDTYFAKSHLLLGEILEEKGENEKALLHYLKVAEIEKPDEELFRKVSNLSLRIGKPELAQPHGQWLFRRQGRDPLIRKLWADLQLEAGKPNKARAIYQGLARELDPPPFGVLAALGRIYSDEERPELARKFLSAALDLDATREETPDGAPSYRLCHEDPVFVKDLLAKLGSEPAQDSEHSETNPTHDDAESPAMDPEAVPARVVSRTPPKYPLAAQRAGIQGRVLVELLIGETGELLKKTVISGDRTLSREALRAVEQWRFAPRLVRGRPEASLMTVAVDFQIGSNR